jgi:quercetin dioxygenase-like cupin family protein
VVGARGDQIHAVDLDAHAVVGHVMYRRQARNAAGARQVCEIRNARGRLLSSRRHPRSVAEALMTGTDITTRPIHLGVGATAEVEPLFTGAMEWYGSYTQRHADDGAEGRLVTMHTFTQSWDMWEMHPQGSEVVLCTAGSITLHQERPDGSRTTVTLGAGQYAINEPGTWHTADVPGSGGATALFITAGLGTQHRPR